MRLVQLLAEYLHTSSAVEWPGADGLTLEEVVETAYQRAVAAGLVPAVDELLDRHVELSDAIRMFFSQSCIEH